MRFFGNAVYFFILSVINFVADLFLICFRRFVQDGSLINRLATYPSGFNKLWTDVIMADSLWFLLESWLFVRARCCE